MQLVLERIGEAQLLEVKIHEEKRSSHRLPSTGSSQSINSSLSSQQQSPQSKEHMEILEQENASNIQLRHDLEFPQWFDERAYQEDDLEDLIGVQENNELHSLTRGDIDVVERIDANLLLYESSTTPAREPDHTFIDDEDIDQSSSTEDENSKNVESDDDIDYD
ncbi:hypothetical protein ACH5RR_026784 [Cinchona calisaya]|uniref:Uncharacterized protein n=1 Tax=Cinchona calisaya TaxID=153742 RepID=A0ABD2Z7H6_9GENT